MASATYFLGVFENLQKQQKPERPPAPSTQHRQKTRMQLLPQEVRRQIHAEGPPEVSHWRSTLSVCIVRKSFYQIGRTQGAYGDTRRSSHLQLQGVREKVCFEEECYET